MGVSSLGALKDVGGCDPQSPCFLERGASFFFLFFVFCFCHTLGSWLVLLDRCSRVVWVRFESQLAAKQCPSNFDVGVDLY